MGKPSIFDESRKLVDCLKADRAARAAAGDKFAALLEAGQARAEAEQRERDGRKRIRLRGLLGLDGDAQPTTPPTTLDAAPKRTRKRRITLDRAMHQAAKAGAAVSAATINTDGGITLAFGAVSEAKVEKPNRWDEVLKRGPAKITVVKR